MILVSASLFDNFMPHGVCYLWRPDILWLNVASDAIIGLAYFSIPFALFHFLRARMDVPFRGVIVMFSVFIFACGLTHFISIVTVWNGYYGIQGIMKAITALASIATALMLFPVMPRLLALRSPLELEAANHALEKQVEQRIKLEQQSRIFMESAPDAIVIVDEMGMIKMVNKQAELMFGYSRDGLIGLPLELLIPECHISRPSSYQEGNLASPGTRPTGVGEELYGRRKDGAEIPVEIKLNAIGSMDRPLVSVAIRDISERQALEAQSRELQQGIAHVSRLTTMGQMAAGLSHELNQPLTAITQNIDSALLILKENNPFDPEMSELLTDIDADAQRAGEIIRALRNFVNKDDTGRAPIDLNSLVQQTVRLIDPEARDSGVDIMFMIGDIIDPVADRVQIAQVLVNLLRNSIDAITEDESAIRKIVVSTRQEADAVTVVVDDSGPGLDPSVEIFKAFETSKGDGMGMGLSISRSIVESHGGQLWSDAKADKGTRFIFSLPFSKAA